MPLRPNDLKMFWRFAAVMRSGLDNGVPLSALEEAYDELASIARHTEHPGLRARCEALMAEYCSAKEAEFTRVPFFDDGLCVICESSPQIRSYRMFL